MNLLLWRGDTLLGELIRRPEPERLTDRPRRPSFSAFLVPASDNVRLSGIWQVVMPAAMRMGVQQYPSEPTYIGSLARSRPRPQGSASSGPVGLEPMSPEAIAGVPPELQLTVRSREGMSYLPATVSVMECRYDPNAKDVEVEEAPPESRRNGIVWLVFVVFASDEDAPEF
jgi:hypothetical protein